MWPSLGAAQSIICMLRRRRPLPSRHQRHHRHLQCHCPLLRLARLLRVKGKLPMLKFSTPQLWRPSNLRGTSRVRVARSGMFCVRLWSNLLRKSLDFSVEGVQTGIRRRCPRWTRCSPRGIVCSRNGLCPTCERSCPRGCAQGEGRVVPANGTGGGERPVWRKEGVEQHPSHSNLS